MPFDPLKQFSGWVDDPARHPMAATFAPPLAQAAPHLMGADDNVFLYRAWKDVLKDYPAYVAQEIGDCFHRATPVLMGDGVTTRRIDEIQVGDEVFTHKGRTRKVLRVLKRPYSGDLRMIWCDSAGVSVSATPDHRFPTISDNQLGVSDTWTRAEEFQTGQAILRFDEGKFLPDRVLTVETYSYDHAVYCLEVEEDHTFIANGYIVSNCTSFGSGHAVDLLQCVEISIGKEPLVYKELCTEAIYGMGREIAGMLGGGDGCYGTAVAKALVTMGATTREAIGPYSGRRAKEWGARGVPAEVKKQAEPFKVGAAALITTLDELDASLANGYPSAGGFSQGFTMRRDQNGCCQQSGRWGHEQCCIGRRRRNGRREYLLGQSWGPNVPDGPLTDDQPNFSFWIDETAMASILSQRDWLAFSKAPQFEKRPLPSSWSTKDFI